MEKKRIKYERPVLVKEKKMTFPVQIIEAQSKRIVCKQCSGCHGCR
jgi:hypothetical protein